MPDSPLLNPQKPNDVSVRLAKTSLEIQAAQRLRYQVFYEEYTATPNKEMAASRLDVDDYDAYADHLIVVDTIDGNEKIIGTYRLLRKEKADEYGQFYSSDEYNLSKLIDSKLNLLELGRSCVLPEYRTRPVLNMLWEGIADYIAQHNIDVMFGCASLHSTDIQSIATPLSYLHHFHPTPIELRARAVKGRYINMNIIPKDELNARKAFSSLPPLIKGYLRVGATIGDGAVIDHQFSTTDVCIIMNTNHVTQKYRDHYERKIQKPLPNNNQELNNSKDNVVSFKTDTDQD